ncbi:E2 [Gammapapillomavirus 23]|uniref:Regulatory protein E2 n=1 Tax=Gammapapillomavirus 23 TaxID=1961680 RepID=A0A2D2AM72_9PAPI|nr:E2 [Gammapapillomavirus 23]
MNQADLTRRSDALQERLLNLYESGAKTLETQIEHWQLVRKINVLYYYARQEGYSHLGLQPLPSLQVSEYKSKEAIHLVLLLRSLQNSQYANEEWSLSDTSTEIIYTPPRNTFKKGAYRVDVWFDNNVDNSFPYTNYDFIYYQDLNEQWHKTAGLVDINGFYYEEPNGDRTYYFLFESDAARYGETGQWTVQFKNQTLSTSVPSSRRPHSTISSQGSVSSSSDSVSPPQSLPSRHHTRSNESEEGSASSTTGTPPQTPVRQRRRRGEGEPTSTTREGPRAKRRRGARAVVGAGVSAGEVGSGHRSVPTSGLTRLARLEAEARDPLIAIFKGRSNQLKCWRYRIPKDLYNQASTVFRWAGEEDDESYVSHRMLVAFNNQAQRKHFLSSVSIPRGVLYAYGQLDSL